MKYKVGDSVRITDDVESLMNVRIPHETAKKLAGNIFTITSVEKPSFNAEPLYIIEYESKGWWLNEGQIAMNPTPFNEQAVNNTFLFSYTIGYDDSVCCPEQIVVIAEGRKEANKKFYEWLTEEKGEFVELTMRCEALGVLE